MSILDMYRSSLQRDRAHAVNDQRGIADLVDKIGRKHSELGRASTPSRQRSLQQEIDRLSKQHGQAQQSLASRMKKIAADEIKVLREEQREQEQATRRAKEEVRKQERAQDRLRRTVLDTSAVVDTLQGRISELEDAVLIRARDAVSIDPVPRTHDVFLSHAGPDKDIASELYAELTARKLDVWFDGAELRLGESLMRQIDRGIAASRLGVILITPTFVKGRLWTEREMGGLFATRRRVIPVVDGVDMEDLARYSPLLADLVGLSTEHHAFDDIAERIVKTIEEADATAS